MPKILCAIISHAKSNRRDTLRKTWIPLVPPEVDVKFFVGVPLETPEDDVIVLNCCDNHENIPEKVREICRWAIRWNYDFMWKVDDDVQLKPSKLINVSSPFTAVILQDTFSICSRISGFLYGFNRECMDILSASSIPVYENGWDCGYYQDEYWVDDKLGKAGITCKLITECGVLYREFENSFPPCWVVAIHGEDRERRSFRAFRQINGLENPLKRRLGRKQ